jgi:hypothetical protein
MYSQKRQRMEGLEQLLPVNLWNEWPLVTPGHITEQLMAEHIIVHKPQGI